MGRYEGKMRGVVVGGGWGGWGGGRQKRVTPGPKYRCQGPRQKGKYPQAQVNALCNSPAFCFQAILPK